MAPPLNIGINYDFHHQPKRADMKNKRTTPLTLEFHDNSVRDYILPIIDSNTRRAGKISTLAMLALAHNPNTLLE